MDVSTNSDRGFYMDNISIFGKNFFGLVTELFDIDLINKFTFFYFGEDLIDTFGFIVHFNFK